MKTILFDLDDTLTISMYVWADAITDLCHFLNWDMDYEKGKGIFHKRIFMEVLQYIHDHSHTEYSVQDLYDHAIGYIKDQYAHHVQPRKGALDFLKYCKEKGMKTAVITSNFRSIADLLLNRLGMMEYIDKVYSCDELGMVKRDPDIFLLAMKELDAKPQETVLIEDSYYAMQTASALGITCIGVETEDNKETFEKEKVVYTKDFTEMRSLLEKVSA